MAGRLDGKVAFITGAARGQGRSNAVRLAEEGADIIAIDLCADFPGTPYPGPTPDDLAETARLVEKTGARIVARSADVRDVAQLANIVDDAVHQLGRLDIVNANAGILLPSRRIADIADREWQDMIDVNLTGAWHTVRVSVPHIRTGRRGGSIVLTSSAAGLRGYPHIPHYTAAKHGLVGLMRSLAIELGPERIRVNCIHPTQVNTVMAVNPSMFKLFVPEISEPTMADFQDRSQRSHVLPVPWVEPIDISNALLFLASEEARYITGVALPVDAGNLLK